VNRSVRGILVGKPIRFDFAAPFPQERQRLKSELENTVCTLYQELESEGARRRTRSA
jgi:hypothetical protein